MTSTPKPFSTVAEIAEMLRVDRHKVGDWIDAGELIARNVATSKATRPVYRIAAADLQAFLDGRASPPKAAEKPRRVTRRPDYREYV